MRGFDMTIRVAELFAGVGGFRLALDGYDDESHGWHLPAAGSYETIWANQWEPPGTATKQFAADCYKLRFGEDSLVNEDIEKVLDQVEAGEMEIPEHDMVVGGFPCQDYSVARPLSQANGIEGKKGVLWWQIYRFLYLCSPKYALFENVDRLLKSPASKNAEPWNLEERVLRNGVMASALPVVPAATKQNTLHIEGEPYEISENFGKGLKVSPFYKAGAMQNGEVYTAEVTADYHGPFETLGDVLVDDSDVPESYFIDSSKLKRWEYFKGGKKEERIHASGFTYMYSEGGMAFPDPIDKPSRTILTSEGGAGASRTKHAVRAQDGRVRRLVPDELDQLQTFPKGWTNSGMTDGRRAFCMGNALVVSIVHRIAEEIARRAGEQIVS